MNTSARIDVRPLNVTSPNRLGALRAATFTLVGGTICTLAGVNGSGKSTRFKTVMAFLGLALGAAALPAQITEWTTTVKPGRFLLEVDAISLSIDREPGLKYTAFGAASTFLTTGLTANWDIQVGANFFLSQKFDAAGLTERQSGVGDMYVRTKWRFYESTDTYTSFAVLPYIKFPTNSGGVGNDAVEGGVIFPFQTQLTGGFNFAAMGKLDLLRNDNDDGYDTYWFASASVGRHILKAIGIYGEATMAKSSGGAPWEGTMGVGATLEISEHAWWDYAIYRGVSSGATDWNHVLRFNYGF